MDKFNSNSILNFYKQYASREKCPDMSKHSLCTISLFGSTYLSEQVFSIMKYTKSSDKPLLSYNYLEDFLRIATFTTEPDIMRLGHNKNAKYRIDSLYVSKANDNDLILL